MEIRKLQQTLTQLKERNKLTRDELTTVMNHSRAINGVVNEGFSELMIEKQFSSRKAEVMTQNASHRNYKTTLDTEE